MLSPPFYEEEVFVKERQISARQLGYGDTRLGSGAGIFSVSQISVSYAYMLAELWGFKKWCTAWRRLFGRVLSWWIWFCQTSLRNVFFFFFGKGESTKQIAMYSRTQEKWVVIRWWHVAGGWVIYPELGSWNPKINFLLRHWAGTEEERVREPWLESVQISADESISVA